MKNILALEMSGESCSVAVSTGGEVFEEYQLAPRQHGQLILKMIDAVCHRANLRVADIDLITFSAGPGSFTGVRLCASVVQGLALANAIPILPVSTLRLLAFMTMQMHQATHVAVAQDARKNEVYLGLYDEQSVYDASVDCDRLENPAEYLLPDEQQWLAVGSGWLAYEHILLLPNSLLIEHFDRVTAPRASGLLQLSRELIGSGANAISASDIDPKYVRNDVTD